MQMVLLIDKKPEEIEDLVNMLKYEGYEPILKTNFEDGIKFFQHDVLSGIFINIDAFDENSCFEFIKTIRKSNLAIPLIVLSSSKSVQNKIYLLSIGVDDYIEKPFSEDEIIARLKAQTRKINALSKKEDDKQENIATIIYSEGSHSYATIGKAKVYFDRMIVKFDDEEINLTNKEANILSLLYRNRGRVLPREVIMKEIWGGKDFITERVIDTNIVSIRKKLRDTGRKPKYIKSVFGIGYKLAEEE